MKNRIMSQIFGGEALKSPPPVGRMLFGGSFNPVHQGHLDLIRFVLDEGVARSVLLMPAAQSPFKGSVHYAPADERLKMLQLGVQTLPEAIQQNITISEDEIRRPGPSYTAETLQRLDSGIQTALLIGADSLQSFQEWKEADWILGRYPLYVVGREGIDRKLMEAWRNRLLGFFPVARVYLLPFQPSACSSTFIRKALAAGTGFDSLKSCLPQSVFAWIRHAGLYVEDDR